MEMYMTRITKMGRIHKTATVMLWIILFVLLCWGQDKSMISSGPKYQTALAIQIVPIVVRMKLFFVTTEIEYLRGRMTAVNLSTVRRRTWWREQLKKKLGRHQRGLKTVSSTRSPSTSSSMVSKW